MNNYGISKSWEDLYKLLNSRTQILSFKVGDKVRYKDYQSIKGTITKLNYSTPYGVNGILINDTLIAQEHELELDTNVYIGGEPFPDISEPAKTKYKCTCTMRELMMKGCTKHE